MTALILGDWLYFVNENILSWLWPRKLWRKTLLGIYISYAFSYIIDPYAYSFILNGIYFHRVHRFGATCGCVCTNVLAYNIFILYAFILVHPTIRHLLFGTPYLSTTRNLQVFIKPLNLSTFIRVSYIPTCYLYVHALCVRKSAGISKSQALQLRVSLNVS